jgi:sugar phosphate permease
MALNSPYSNGNQYRWTILAALFVTHVLTSVGSFSIPILLPLIKNDFGLTHTQVGIVTASYFLGTGLMSAVAGWPVDFFGFRKMLVFGSLLVGGSLITAAWMPNFGMMMALLILAGTGYSVVTPSTNKAVMYWFNERVRATVMGFKQTGINGGGFLAGMIIPPLALALSWHLALSAAGLVVMGTSVITMIVYREGTSGRRVITVHQWFIQVKEVIRNRNILLLSAEGFFRVGVQMAFLTYLVLFLQKTLNLRFALASLLFAIVQASGAAGRIAWGFVSDRIFGGRRKAVYMLTGLIAMACFFLLGQLGQSTPLWAALVTVSCLGFTAVGHQGVGLALLGECAGLELTGTASGIGQSLFFLGVVLISPFLGFIVDTFETFSHAWSSLALLSLLCCLILYFVQERPKSSERR